MTSILSSKQRSEVITGLIEQGCEVLAVKRGRQVRYPDGTSSHLDLETGQIRSLQNQRARVRQAGIRWPLDPVKAERPARSIVKKPAPPTARPEEQAQREEQHMGVTHKVQEVTPDLAAKWLETNIKNRRLSTPRVEKLAAQMKDGLWRFDASPIRFDEHGHLVDGQHRLWALIEADYTTEFLVVRGVEERAMTTMDTGKTRSFADILSLNEPGLGDITHLAAAVLIIYRWEQHARGGELRSAGKRSVPYSLLLDFFRENRERLVTASKRGRNLSQKTGVAGSVMSLTAWVLPEIDWADADYFFDRIVDGIELEEESPILALRNWMIKTRPITPKPTVDTSLAMIFKAWNAYRAGDSIRILSWKRGGSSPESFPEPR